MAVLTLPEAILLLALPLAAAGVTLFARQRRALRECQLAVAAHQRAEARMREIIDSLPARISQFDRQERVLYANRYCGVVYRCDPADLVGKTIREVRGDKAYATIKTYIDRVLAGEHVSYEHALERDGELRHYQQDYVPDVDAAGRVQGFYSVSFEITDRQRAAEVLDRLTRTDPLTGLMNRREFEQRLPEAVARCRRFGKPMALLFLDVDHFKAVNDTFGHATGDEVLKAFAHQLAGAVRQTDTVARLAGDEFVVILEALTRADEAALVAQKIVQAVNQPFDGAAAVRQVSASAGLALHDGGESTAEQLLARADAALYDAKAAGRNTFCVR
ncbi:GGDEF domain-containing protein [Piscinibacter terrae]|nr:GGDEF domain-containing protein [Albitalea terrae]